MGLWIGEDAMVESFAARFEDEGGQHFFRRNLGAAPVRVAIAERDDAISRFRWGTRYLIFGGVAILVAAFFALLALDDKSGAPADALQISLMLVVLFAAYVFVWLHLWNAPVREFQNRVPVSPERAHREARRIALGQFSWSQIAMVPLISLVILLPRHHEGFSGLGFDIKLGLVGLLTLLAIVQAVRKWRSEHIDL